ncbi:hypothetical protein FHL15_001947 [Xylaria flabelliformis]|uniref:F-box domain-containing protein n=1 Tax=Xylaria flabelliformis TaxID=2512241 RepID=A0A553IAD0_9PEZI|nr:hypothetical protein FHL15_001947 [Xylaria flabelliformis]
MPVLVTLPIEIIRNICDQLVPYVIATGTEPPLRNEHQLCKHALWSLTLVSHHIGGIATELLYKNVVITSTKQMVCLFRTIYDKPEFRRHPRYLANLVPLMDSGLQGEIEANIQRHCPLLPAGIAGSTQTYPRELYHLDSPALFLAKPLWTHEIIRYLLAMLPRLKDILISILANMTTLAPSFIEDTDQTFFAEPPRFLPFSEESQTLRIQWQARESLYDKAGVGPLFQLYFPPYISNGCRMTDLRFLNLANVTNYEIDYFYDVETAFGSHRLVRSKKNRGFFSWLAKLKALNLGYSTVGLQFVGQLLAACPQLKKLTWEFWWPWNDDLPDSSDVESALQQTAGHLEELYFSLANLHGPISFRHFRALKHLSVGIEVLSSYSHESKRTGGDPATPITILETPLISLLPETLVHLTLVNEDYGQLGSDQRKSGQIASNSSYRDIVMDGYVVHGRQLFPTWLADGLETLSCSCQTMPHLRSITVIQPLHSILPAESSWQIEVGDLTAKFRAAGVRFSTRITTREKYGREDPTY